MGVVTVEEIHRVRVPGSDPVNLRETSLHES